jgi:hypothetical protein
MFNEDVNEKRLFLKVTTQKGCTHHCLGLGCASGEPTQLFGRLLVVAISADESPVHEAQVLESAFGSSEALSSKLNWYCQ